MEAPDIQVGERWGGRGTQTLGLGLATTGPLWVTAWEDRGVGQGGGVGIESGV